MPRVRRIAFLFVFVCALLTAPTALRAQQAGIARGQPLAQQEALAGFAHMKGTWEGDGWMDLGGGQRGMFRVTEVVPGG